MIIWGINALNHDASICVFRNNKIIWHKRSSEFSGQRGDPELNHDMVIEARKFGDPALVYWYERPWVKKLRQLRAGQFDWAFNFDELPSRYLKKFYITAPIHYTAHHHSHAAAGYYTSPFNDAAVVVLDAIGEFESMTIWHGKGRELTKVWSASYPNSLGLFYSAFTELIGYPAGSGEHLVEEMSTRGDPNKYYSLVNSYFKNGRLVKNLHQGIQDWPYDYDPENDLHIAAAVQRVYEEQMMGVMLKAKRKIYSNNLVFMGGCAMNAAANQTLHYQFNRVWSLPWPGDASSSIGAVLARTKLHTEYKSNEIVKHLKLVYN